ncbi:MAG: phospholipase A [Bacteroides sp.]|nr:phospholipase A [Bacteroidales bacterium]MBD5317468.1 phospholipase A [Bacteroides sp.]MBD5377856.1 phospholipase A [Bacteroides sp.]
MIVAVILSLAGAERCKAQIVSTSTQPEIDTDSVRRAFDRGPYFGLYKDNYFIFGTAIGNEKPSKTNTNIKFQISIAQRLTRSTLPWNTYIYLFYSQKCFWNVLENSMPMTDLNFNPGIGWTKPFFVKNRYVGKMTLIAEHESNGRDGAASRSWNKLSLAASVIIDPLITVHGKIWLPIIDGQNNKDILDYSGIYQVGTSFTTANQRFGASVVLVKRRGWNLNYNTIVELNYRLFKRDNQYIFIQYYNGYGEGLLAYKEFHSEIRAGIVIKPRLFSEF